MLSKNSVETSRPLSGHHIIWYWKLVDYIRQAISVFILCTKIKHERESLARLTDSELQDLGIHRADVDAECRRSFFDIPEDRIDL